LLAGLDSQDAEEDNSEHLATVEDDALSLGDSSPSSATALGSPTLDLALVLIGLLAIIVVLFFMAQDLGVMSVVSTTLILVLTMIVLFVSRVYRQGLTGLMREREAALAWQITCLAVLVAVWAVFVLPQFAEAVARFFGYTRVLVRTECAASSYYYFECQQALSGLRQIIEGSGSGRYWIANAHSDLIFGTVAGNLGNWGLAVLVAGLSAIMAPLLWSIHRHLQAAVKHLTGSFNAQPKIDPYSGIESAALQLFLVSAFFIQVCVHVASGLASTYQIGITLPFVSQGGGSLIAWLIALGICARHMLMVRQSADWR
jgi:cell division protein FtsW (lipid II flippase)